MLKSVYDCSTGTFVTVELARDEAAEIISLQAAVAAADATAIAGKLQADVARDADLATVRDEAAKSPAYAALARAAGLIGPEEGMK